MASCLFSIRRNPWWPRVAIALRACYGFGVWQPAFQPRHIPFEREFRAFHADAMTWPAADETRHAASALSQWQPGAPHVTQRLDCAGDVPHAEAQVVHALTF